MFPSYFLFPDSFLNTLKSVEKSNPRYLETSIDLCHDYFLNTESAVFFSAVPKILSVIENVEFGRLLSEFRHDIVMLGKILNLSMYFYPINILREHKNLVLDIFRQAKNVIVNPIWFNLIVDEENQIPIENTYLREEYLMTKARNYSLLGDFQASLSLNRVFRLDSSGDHDVYLEDDDETLNLFSMITIKDSKYYREVGNFFLNRMNEVERINKAGMIKYLFKRHDVYDSYLDYFLKNYANEMGNDLVTFRRKDEKFYAFNDSCMVVPKFISEDIIKLASTLSGEEIKSKISFSALVLYEGRYSKVMRKNIQKEILRQKSYSNIPLVKFFSFDESMENPLIQDEMFESFIDTNFDSHREIFEKYGKERLEQKGIICKKLPGIILTPARAAFSILYGTYDISDRITLFNIEEKFYVRYSPDKDISENKKIRIKPNTEFKIRACFNLGEFVYRFLNYLLPVLSPLDEKIQYLRFTGDTRNSIYNILESIKEGKFFSQNICLLWYWFSEISEPTTNMKICLDYLMKTSNGSFSQILQREVPNIHKYPAVKKRKSIPNPEGLVLFILEYMYDKNILDDVCVLTNEDFLCTVEHISLFRRFLSDKPRFFPIFSRVRNRSEQEIFRLYCNDRFKFSVRHHFTSQELQNESLCVNLTEQFREYKETSLRLGGYQEARRRNTGDILLSGISIDEIPDYDIFYDGNNSYSITQDYGFLTNYANGGYSPYTRNPLPEEDRERLKKILSKFHKSFIPTTIDDEQGNMEKTLISHINSRIRQNFPAAGSITIMKNRVLDLVREMEDYDESLVFTAEQKSHFRTFSGFIYVLFKILISDSNNYADKIGKFLTYFNASKIKEKSFLETINNMDRVRFGYVTYLSNPVFKHIEMKIPKEKK